LLRTPGAFAGHNCDAESRPLRGLVSLAHGHRAAVDFKEYVREGLVPRERHQDSLPDERIRFLNAGAMTIRGFPRTAATVTRSTIDVLLVGTLGTSHHNSSALFATKRSLKRVDQ
jgi:hypothetical protein